ncbi:MAG: RNA polymerase sigma factor [Alphaproteobacteria bacterium]
MSDGDKELALKAAGGCRASFAALIECYYDRIYRLAWRFCGAQDLAEDIAQDVCVKLATAILKFRGEAAFSTWIWRITYTTATDKLRAGQRMRAVEPSKMVELTDAASETGQTSPEDAAMEADLWTTVRALPPQQRDAVLLVYGEDMSHAEAAAVRRNCIKFKSGG